MNATSDNHKPQENFYFLICYLAAPRPTLGHYLGDNLTHQMLISAFQLISTQGSLGAS